ncbi:APC family permease [Agrococcus sp. Marseille-P2731]|uniref:APC family permease n=1 Tax=Agrococcus sp. Marseille-P2731 TaxID=1841862 RepID=UPI0009311E28|nr:APC family permease [Agrococcus sp. Marseille-P2731]
MSHAHAPASEAATDQHAPSKLKRGITGPLLFVFILGDVLGAGVYALTGELSGEVGGAMWLPLLVALLLALLTAGSYAELVTKYPRAGGASVFALRAFKSPIVSFLVGFCMLAAGVVSAAGLALAFAGYFESLVPVAAMIVAPVFLVLVAALNARGIRESLASNVVMTIIELSGLLLIIVAVALMVSGGGGDLARVGEFPADTNPAVATLAAAIIAYYSFVGFETSANVAEEIQNPTKVYPRALIGSLLVAGVVYVLVGLASAIALPSDELSGSTSPLLDVFAATGLPVPGWIFSLIALIAVANGALLTMIMASRLTYGMAEQRLLPSVLGRVLPRRRTPWVAIVVTTAIAIGLTFIGDLGTLAETVVLLLLFVFLSTNIAVLVLRRDRVEHEHFRVWSWVPVLGIGSCILLLTQQEPHVWLFGGIALIVGLIAYVASGGLRRRGARAEPVEAPETEPR